MPTAIRFDPDKHTYRLDGERYPIASVSGLVASRYPFNGDAWKMGQAAAVIADRWQEIAAMPPSLRKAEIAAIGREGMDRAATFGKTVHAYAETLWTGAPIDVDPAYVPWVEAVASWWDDEQPTVVAAERIVYSPAIGDRAAYAGTFDLMVNTPRDGLGLIDIKTKTPYGSGAPKVKQWAMQLAGYANATKMQLADGTGDTVFPDVEWLAVLHVGEGECELIRIDGDAWAHGHAQIQLARMLRALR